jgi:rhodanese-related sulfurtransferase
MVNINSNYLWSALLGGVIMGFGFILGGFCPGTSVTAAAIGKIDAWFFISGIFLGVFIFGQFDDFFNIFYSGYYFDSELLYNTLGISRGWFALMMIVMALVGFGVGKYFEQKAKIGLKPTNKPYRSYKLEVVFVLIIGIIIIYLPENKSEGINQISEKTLMEKITDNNRFVSPQQFAYNLMNNNKEFEVVDVRNTKEFSISHFPGSVNVPLDQLKEDYLENLIRKENKKVVFVSDGGVEASKAWIFASRSGYKNIWVLEGGINNFISDIFFPEKPGEKETDYTILSNYRFRLKAAEYFKNGELLKDILIKTDKNEANKEKTVIPFKSGGC